MKRQNQNSLEQPYSRHDTTPSGFVALKTITRPFSLTLVGPCLLNNNCLRGLLTLLLLLLLPVLQLPWLLLLQPLLVALVVVRVVVFTGSKGSGLQNCTATWGFLQFNM